MAIDPTISGLFPDIDWLIGNHSDELTPWIPVMAARYVNTVSTYLVRCLLIFVHNILHHVFTIMLPTNKYHHYILWVPPS